MPDKQYRQIDFVAWAAIIVGWSLIAYGILRVAPLFLIAGGSFLLAAKVIELLSDLLEAAKNFRQDQGPPSGPSI